MLKDTIAKRLIESGTNSVLESPEEAVERMSRVFTKLIVPYSEEISKNLQQVQSTEGLEDEIADMSRELTSVLSSIIGMKHKSIMLRK